MHVYVSIATHVQILRICGYAYAGYATGWAAPVCLYFTSIQQHIVRTKMHKTAQFDSKDMYYTHAKYKAKV